MVLRYSKVRKKPQTFLRLFGVSVSQFEAIFGKVYPVWQQKILKHYKRPGRPHKLEVPEIILVVLLYYRSYITQEFLGYLFGLDASQICRLIKKLEPILAQVMALSKRKELSQEEVGDLIIDATEQPIERPKKDQKLYYSGKKKRHTLKTEVRINLQGRIVHISQSKPGSVHDFTLFKQEPPPPDHSRLFVDSGYQGIDKVHSNAEFPYKSTKNKPLDAEEKTYNFALSRLRVLAENSIGKLKVFKILSDRYRNKRKRYNLKFNIISGIVNLKGGFQTS